MSNIINFPISEIADTIEIIRSDEFNRLAQNISDTIKNLPLTHEDNNRLVALMVKQLNEAETTSYLQGFDMGIKVMNVG